MTIPMHQQLHVQSSPALSSLPVSALVIGVIVDWTCNASVEILDSKLDGYYICYRYI